MRVSFIYPSDNADLTVDMIYQSNSGKLKIPSYHNSVSQLSGMKDIDGIIIPGKLNEHHHIDYDPIFLLKHIRLLEDQRISTLPVYMSNTPESVFDQISKVLAIGLESSFDESFNFQEKSIGITNLEDIRKTIGTKMDAISRHNLSNEWGAYRLSRQMSQLGMENDEFSSIKNKLSEGLYYKRLLVEESKQIAFKITDNQKTSFRGELYNINAKVKNIAIIDDMIKKGWDKAYSKIFGDTKLSLFDQKEEVFDVSKSNDYDLIILDLRLEEDSKLDESDILEVENLSGIKVLKEIKALDPTVPVIISTASNKSWSVRSAMDNGADGFWTKEDPKRSLSLEYRFQNTFDLINVINGATAWASQYRELFEMFDKIEDAISKNTLMKRY